MDWTSCAVDAAMPMQQDLIFARAGKGLQHDVEAGLEAFHGNNESWNE